MLTEERRERILEILRVENRVKVKNLSQSFSVSTETIRRDLEHLENINKLKRTHGGAVKKKNVEVQEYYFQEKKKLNLAQKTFIAKRAAQMVDDGDIIAMGSGSTVLQMVEYLKEKKNLTVLTSSLPLINSFVSLQMKGEFNGKLILIGGEINYNSFSAEGKVAENTLDEFSINKAFFSSDGVSLEKGASIFSMAEGGMISSMVKNCETSILMADSSKMGKNQFYRVLPLERFDIIVSDTSIPENWKASLEGIQWIQSESWN